MTEPNDARHLELVSAAQRQWIDALTGLTRLFTGADIRADAIHRMQTIYRKARELTEARGSGPATLPPDWPAGTSCSSSPPRRYCCGD